MRRAAVLVVCCGCAAERAEPSRVTAPPGTIALSMLSDDYQVGTLGLVDPETLELTPDVLSLHSDAVVVTEGDALWAVNRLSMDNVRRYGREQLGLPELEVSTGAGSNPHDVATCGGRALVTRYEEPELWALDPDTGDRVGAVDLADHADGDGVPEMSDLVVDGDRAWVGLQRLDRRDGWSPAPRGRVVEVDCVALTVARWWDVGPDPVLRVDPSRPGELVVLADDGVWRLRPDAERLDGPWYADPSRPVVDAAFGADGAGLLIAREGSVHHLSCVPALGAPETRLEAFGNYLSGVAVDVAGRGWVAARRGWEDPSVPGGLLAIDVATCTSLTGDAWVRGALAPFSVAVW